MRMSMASPSSTRTLDSVDILKASTILSSGTPLSAVRASIWKALNMRRSPASMARGVPYRTWTASTPLLI